MVATLLISQITALLTSIDAKKLVSTKYASSIGSDLHSILATLGCISSFFLESRISRKWAICAGYLALALLFVPFSFFVQDLDMDSPDVGTLMLGWPSLLAFAFLLASFP